MSHCVCGNEKAYYASKCWDCHLAEKRAKVDARPECPVIGCHFQAYRDHGFCKAHEHRAGWPDWKQEQPNRATVEYVIWKFKDHPKPIEVVSTTGRMKDPTTFNNPECDHPEWVAIASHVASDGSGCPECSPSTRTMDLEELHQVMIDAGWEPISRYANSRDGWMSICLNCKQIGYPSLTNARAGKRHDCHQFRYKLEDVVETMGLYGFDVVDGSEFEDSNSWMRFRHRECGTITRRKPSRYLIDDADYFYPPRCAVCRNPWGMNLETLAAMISEKGYIPITDLSEIQTSNDQIVVLHLECNTESTVRLSNLLYRDTTGCVYCSPRGFNYREAAIVYLIEISPFDFKFGITNLDPDMDPRDGKRVPKFETLLDGKLRQFWRFDIGEHAHQVEQQIKRDYAAYIPDDPRDPKDGRTERIKCVYIGEIENAITRVKQQQAVERLEPGTQLSLALEVAL